VPENIAGNSTLLVTVSTFLLFFYLPPIEIFRYNMFNLSHAVILEYHFRIFCAQMFGYMVNFFLFAFAAKQRIIGSGCSLHFPCLD
jgi:hypothetical protein